MSSLRKTALVAGVLYLITFLASIPAVILLQPVLNDPNYILGAGADGRVLLGCVLDIVNALAAVGTAVALFSVVKRQHEGLALGFVTSRLLEAAIIFPGVLALVAVVMMRQTLVGGGGADTAAIAAAGHSLVALRNASFLLGPSLMPGINALLLGTLMYRSRLVPRAIPVIGLVGGPLLIGSVIAMLFGVYNMGSTWSGVATAPIFAWELSLGLWMTIKGFNPSPITAGMVAASTPPANRGAAA
ncbi:MAG: DUF4386 domain-containing protein [Candidatus Dormibacteraeota bacterium]|nr:DUF4386 domain-containing protein [Candidatus Dormibacteraeota bacterium]